MSDERVGSTERRVTENDQEFLMRTLTKHQWDVVAKCLRAEVEMATMHTEGLRRIEQASAREWRDRAEAAERALATARREQVQRADAAWLEVAELRERLESALANPSEKKAE